LVLVNADDLGFAIEGRLFSGSECDELTRSLSHSSVQRSRAGARHLMSNETVAAIAADARLITMASQWLDAGATPFRATLFEKSAATNWLIPWHQDTALPLESVFDEPGWGPWSRKADVHHAHAPAWALERVIALRVHLDASTAENGPLRVIPRSHLSGVLTDDRVLDFVKRHEPVECVVPRGGVIAMRPLLIHSSSKARNEDPRRVLHFEYADSLNLNPRIRLAIA
jgi:ectoine hydroxylase-related dioxygenase (phytanoyl-CoA dioxygenase family)